MTVPEYLFHGVFAVLVFGVPAFLAWASSSDAKYAKGIDVSALWTHNGRPDKFAVIILGTWWVHTTAMILWILTQTVNDSNVVQYMGWALPIIARMFAPSSPPQKPEGG